MLHASSPIEPAIGRSALRPYDAHPLGSLDMRMNSKSLHPRQIDDYQVLLLRTTKPLRAWLQSHSFGKGGGKIFSACDLPALSLLAFEKLDLWLLAPGKRQRVRLYDFPCGNTPTTNAPQGYEVLLTLSSAMTAGYLEATHIHERQMLHSHTTTRSIAISDDHAASLIESCELLPASNKQLAEYRLLYSHE